MLAPALTTSKLDEIGVESMSCFADCVSHMACDGFDEPL